MNIIFSSHSEEQNLKRRIPKEFVEIALRRLERIESDKLDSSLTHYIKFIEGRFLRVIIKKEGSDILVITYFYDRRLKMEEK